MSAITASELLALRPTTVRLWYHSFVVLRGEWVIGAFTCTDEARLVEFCQCNGIQVID